MESDERVRVVFGQCKHDLSKDWLRVKQYRGHRTYSIYNLDERRLIRYVKDYFRVFFFFVALMFNAGQLRCRWFNSSWERGSGVLSREAGR